MTGDVDVLIVGAGPCGLYAAYYAGFRGLSVAVVDSLAMPGGQVTAMYPEKLIYDIAGFPAVRGRDLVDALVQQAGQFQPSYLLGRQACELVDHERGFEVRLEAGGAIRAAAILITAGLGGFTPRPLPAGEGWVGRGVVFFVVKPDAHADQDVIIVGGGDSAFDWALALQPVARSVTLVHRRSTFRAHAATVAKVRDLGAQILTGAQVTELRGEHHVSECEILTDSGHRRVQPAQAVVAALGFLADLGPIQSWGLQTKNRTILVDSRMRTSRERVFAAGDVADYPGKVKLIATGFGEAATAINNIAVELDPSAHLFPGHSSN